MPFAPLPNNFDAPSPDGMNVPSPLPRTRVSTDIYGQTVGAFQYGAAEAGHNILGYVGGKLWSDNQLTQWSRELQDFKETHPEYAPEEVDTWWDLIKSPRAIAGRVSSAIPQLILFGGALAVPGGTLVAGALSYAMESQRGYEEAKLMGADEDTATKNAIVKGVIGGAINLITMKGLFSFVKGAEKLAAEKAALAALGVAAKHGLTGQALKFVATQAAFGVFTQAEDELVSQGILGKPVAPGFLDRLVQAAIGNAAAMSVFGFTVRSLKAAVGEVAVIKLGNTHAEMLAELGLQTTQGIDISKIEAFRGFHEAVKRPENVGLYTKLKDSLRPVYGFAVDAWAGLRPGVIEDYFKRNAVNTHLAAKQAYANYWPRLREALIQIGDEKGLKELGKIVVEEPAMLVTGPSGKFGWTRWSLDGDANTPRHDPAKSSNPVSEFWNNVMRLETGEAYRAGGGMQRIKGKKVPFTPADTYRIPRTYDYGPGTFADLVAKNDPIARDIIEGIRLLNIGKSQRLPNDLMKYYQTNLTSATAGHYGFVEEIRRVPIVPDVWVGKNGRKVRITTSGQDIVHSLEYAVERTVQKIAEIKMTGQEGIRNIKDRAAERLLKDLGSETKMDDAEIIANLDKVGIKTAQVTNWLNAKGSLAQLAKLARVNTHLTKDVLIDRMRLVDPMTLTAEQTAKLTAFATKVQGIDPNLATPELLKAVTERMGQVVVEDGIKKLLTDYATEGGDPKDLAKRIRMWQMKRVAEPLPGIAQIASTALAAQQTSLSVIPNLTQTLFMGPRYLGGGIKGLWRLMRSASQVFTNVEKYRSEQIALGTIAPSVAMWVRNEGMKGWARNIGTAAARITGLRYMDELNGIIMGNAAKGMMLEWRANGIPRNELIKAQQIGFSPAEIAEIQSGKMSDFTFRKGIQKTSWKVNYNPDAGFSKAMLQSHPWASFAFAYSTYTSGALRNLADVHMEIVQSIKSGNPAAMLGAAKSIFSVLVGVAGAGAAISMLRSAAKGQLQGWKDKDLMEQGIQAMGEVAVLGPAQRMLDAFSYSNGVSEKLIMGMMPKFAGIIKYLSAVLGYGQYGKFRIDQRLWEAFKGTTPAVRGIDNWVNAVAYPQLGEYRSARAAGRRFEKDVLKRETGYSTDTPMDPEYFKIFQSVARGDLDEAKDLSLSYYQEKVQGGMPIQEAAARLRSSLNGRQPLPFSDANLVGFLSQLDEKQRDRVLSAQTQYDQIVNQIAPGTGGSRVRTMGRVSRPRVTALQLAQMW